MRFLILTSAFSIDGSRPDMLQQLAEELVARGHSADLISMGMGEDAPRGPLPIATVRLRAFSLGGPLWWMPSRGAVKYASNLWRLNLNRALGAWLRGPYDGFLFFTPGVMSAGIGHRLRQAGVVKKTGFILWDFFPVSSEDSGSLHLGPAAQAAYNLERRIAAATDVLLPMSPAGAAFARAYFRLPEAAMATLPPWGRSESAPVQVPKFDRFTCVWGGQFIPLRAIPDLIEAARILEAEGIAVDFRLAGDGPLLEETRRGVSALGLKSVHFEGRLARDEYRALLGRSHLALSVIEPVSSPCFPSKTVDYCRAGLPMVASVEDCSDYGTLISEAGFGIAVRAGDSVGIADAIRQLAIAPQERLGEMSKASRSYFDEHLSVEAAARTIEQVFC